MPWIHMAPMSVGLLKVVWSVNARPPTLSKKAKEKRRYNIGIFFKNMDIIMCFKAG